MHSLCLQYMLYNLLQVKHNFSVTLSIQVHLQSVFIGAITLFVFAMSYGNDRYLVSVILNVLLIPLNGVYVWSKPASQVDQEMASSVGNLDGMNGIERCYSCDSIMAILSSIELLMQYFRSWRPYTTIIRRLDNVHGIRRRFENFLSYLNIYIKHL